MRIVKVSWHAIPDLSFESKFLQPVRSTLICIYKLAKCILIATIGLQILIRHLPPL